MKLFRVAQWGLSLVELLIALAISSFLIIGLSQVYIDHKRTYIFQQSQMANLESSRFALWVIDDLLGKAGYRRAPSQSMEQAFPPAAALTRYCEDFAAGSVISKVKSQGNEGYTGFCIRYQPAVADEKMCDGNEVPVAVTSAFTPGNSNDIVYSAIVFKPHTSEADQGTLSCVTPNGAVELLNGIADLRVEFGAGEMQHKRLTTGTPFKLAQRWSAADGPVRAVRYAVLAASRKYQRDAESAIYSQWLARAPSHVQARLAAQDQRQIYQVAQGSQALRNMMP